MCHCSSCNSEPGRTQNLQPLLPLAALWDNGPTQPSEIFMSTIAIRPVSSFTDVVLAHVARGYEVLVVSDLWPTVQSLTRRLGRKTDQKTTLMMASLARRIHQAQKSGEVAFGGSTIIVLDERTAQHKSVASEQVYQAALDSTHDIVFLHVPTE